MSQPQDAGVPGGQPQYPQPQYPQLRCCHGAAAGHLRSVVVGRH